MRTLGLLLLLGPLFAQGIATPYGAGCPSPGPSAIGFAPNPGAGRIELFETAVATGSLSFATLGFSSTMWESQPLPFSLAYLGLTNCSVLADPVSVNGTTLPSNGIAEYFVDVPPPRA